MMPPRPAKGGSLRTLLLLLPLAAVAYFVWQSDQESHLPARHPFSPVLQAVGVLREFARSGSRGGSAQWRSRCSGSSPSGPFALGGCFPRGGAQEIGARPLRAPSRFRGTPARGARRLLVLSVLATAYRHADLSSPIVEAAGVASMLLGYLLVRGIVCHSGRAEVMRFLQAIVVVNTVAAALFIVHQGLHIRSTAGGSTTRRSFRARSSRAPSPSCRPCSSSPSRRVREASLDGVDLCDHRREPGAVWVSYTRTMLAMAAMVAVISIFARLLKGGQEMLAIRRVLAIITVVVAVAVVLVTMLPRRATTS